MSAKSPSNNKLRLTKKSAELLRKNWKPGAPRRYWDTELAGFYLQLTPAGVASYCVRYTKPDGSKGDYTIGRASLISPERARDATKERLADLVLNREDPVAARQASRRQAQKAKEGTFEEVGKRYIEARKRQRPEGAPFQDEWRLEFYVYPLIGKVPIQNVTRQMAKDVVLSTQAAVQNRNASHQQHYRGVVSANRAHGVMRRVFEFALDSELVDKNPARFKRLFHAHPEKRIGIVTEEAFRAIWLELDDKSVRKRQMTPLALQIYMLTLQRPLDIARARREDFDFVTMEWRIPWRRTKAQRPYLIPMSPQVMERVQEAFAKHNNQWLFPGAKNSKTPHVGSNSMRIRLERANAVLVKTGILPPNDIEMYDYRRFGRTQLRHKLSFPKEIAERVINHSEGKGIDELYDVTDYRPLVREAHNAWCNEVWRMVYGEKEQ